MPTEGYWRRKARLCIEAVIKEHGRDHPDIKKLISKAYPFGHRDNYPYTVWLDEVKVQLGTKVPRCKPAEVRDQDRIKAGQLTLEMAE